MDIDHGHPSTADADPPAAGRTDGGEPAARAEAGEQRSDRFWLLVIGLLVVTMPALVLVVVYAVLLATQSVLIGQITLLEAAELYVIEVAAFALFSYLLYRLTLYSIRRQAAVADAETDEDTEAGTGTGTGAGGRGPSEGAERPEVE